MLEIKEKELGLISRLTNKTFKFDKRYGEGYFSASYFLKTEQIIKEKYPNTIVTLQWFTRKESRVCGLDEAIALLHTFARNPFDLKIEALNDGDYVKPFEPVLKVHGRYQDFGYLEGAIDGILARRTSVCTNCDEIMKAKSEKANVMFFGDRDDDPRNHPGDGYAAYVAGVKLVCTDAMGEWTGQKGIGTMPHALIVMHENDLISASVDYHNTFPNDNLTVLVDTNNDVVLDSLLVARYFKEKLFAVRIDTSISLVDKYFERHPEVTGVEKHGVNVTLVKALRKALDDEGFNHVKIVVSSGFDREKVQLFTKENAPVDTYGIGGSLIKCTRSFTGDVVNINGKAMAKVGRKEMFSSRLVDVKYDK
ncbi:MAG: nicotinate phosphoribosyltransferase [Erysipelotrichaceae bacterium]|nr:nicotinate phosphoribosyltransferase [Erysipelotrichaceae bacterium]